jgi:hypothetical protein
MGTGKRWGAGGEVQRGRGSFFSLCDEGEVSRMDVLPLPSRLAALPTDSPPLAGVVVISSR